MCSWAPAVTGTPSDSHTIRLGRPYDGTVGQNQTFIAGIYGSPLTAGASVVYVDANGQLGTAVIGSGGGGFLPMSQLQQHERDQDKQLRDQQSVIADLRAAARQVGGGFGASRGRKVARARAAILARKPSADFADSRRWPPGEIRVWLARSGQRPDRTAE